MTSGTPELGVVLALIVGLLASVTIMFFIFRTAYHFGPRK